MSNNIEAEQLEKFGATCSVCGQAFSSSANIASVAELANQKYKGKKVNIATCTIPPYIHKHSKKDTTIKTVYQTADNKAGFITLMYKDLDKPPVQRCPTCNSPITETPKPKGKTVVYTIPK